jgi:flagellar hook-basal body complex protein FliE
MQIPGMNSTLNAATALAGGGQIPAPGPGLAGTSPVAGGPFGDLLKSAVTGVNDLQQQASSAVTGMMAGNGVDIHDAMIATQKADMAFELTLAVRNKAVAAYQQVMGMQF